MAARAHVNGAARRGQTLYEEGWDGGGEQEGVIAPRRRRTPPEVRIVWKLIRVTLPVTLQLALFENSTRSISGCPEATDDTTIHLGDQYEHAVR